MSAQNPILYQLIILKDGLNSCLVDESVEDQSSDEKSYNEHCEK